MRRRTRSMRTASPREVRRAGTGLFGCSGSKSAALLVMGTWPPSERGGRPLKQQDLAANLLVTSRCGARAVDGQEPRGTPSAGLY